MCIHLFAPGTKLQIDYAAESLVVSSGACSGVFDILVTNHSATAVDRIHIVYPHATPADNIGTGESASFRDLTDTWLDSRSPLNQYYQTPSTQLAIKHVDGDAELTVRSVNPNDLRTWLDYSGHITGPHSLLPYELCDGDQLDQDEWKILNMLGWSVITLKFQSPMLPSTPRWLRLAGRSGVMPQNRRPRLDRWIKVACGILADTFEIIGPLDVEYRIVSFLRAASTWNGDTPVVRYSSLKLQSLQEKLINRGIGAPGTETIIQDWRLNVFGRNYRYIDEPIAWGDLRPCGNLYNALPPNVQGQTESAFQWKGGTRNVPEPGFGGFFSARLRAHVVPSWVLFVPWIGLLVGSLALLTRPDVIKLFRSLLHGG